jgi:hypothetical protein
MSASYTMRLSAFILCLLLASCATKRMEPLNVAGRDAERIIVRTGVIDGQVKQIKGNEPQKRTIGEQSAAIRSDAKDVQSQLTTAQTIVATLEAEIHRYERNRWVSVALWCQKAFWIVLTVWAAAGIFAILAGLSPLSGIQRLGQEIVRLIPAMNIFSWIRDKLQARRLRKEPETIVKSSVERATRNDQLSNMAKGLEQ